MGGFLKRCLRSSEGRSSEGVVAAEAVDFASADLGRCEVVDAGGGMLGLREPAAVAGRRRDMVRFRREIT